MKKLLFAVVILMASCSESNRNKTSVCIEVHKTIMGNYIAIDSSKFLRTVDTLFKVNDIVKDGGTYFKILN